MATAWLCQIDGIARVGGAATTIRLASHDDDRLCHLNGTIWWPSIARLPTFAYDFFDGAFGGDIATPSGQAEVSIDRVPGFAALMLHDARIRWWSGEQGAAWATFVLRFDGYIDNHPPVRAGVASVSFRVDDRWLDDPLLRTYAGTAGAEGEAALKGQVKPLMIGAPRMAEGVLINSIDTIVQLNDGPFGGIDAAMENAQRFGAPVADYADYAALQAATIAPGFVATALAAGLVRHGAPGDGLFTYDVQGSSTGDDAGGQVRLPGAIVKRLAAKLGKLDKVDAAGMLAIDAVRPWPLSLALTQQTTLRLVAQSIAQSVNAVALVTWTGLLTMLPIAVPETATAVGTLAADGSSLPPVANVDQLGIASPWWRLAIEAEVTHRVHGTDEIRFQALLVDRGRYDDAETYREGHIVDLADGSRWLYTAIVPTAGNDPAIGSAYWTLLSGPIGLGDIGGIETVRAPSPPPEEMPIGSYYHDAANRQYRFEGIGLTFDGDPITFGGEAITMPGYIDVLPDAVRDGAFAVEIVPPLTQTIYTDFAGSQLPGQFPPRVLTPTVKQGGVDIRTANQVQYSIVASGVTASVNSTIGSADKGRITVTAGGIGHILLTVAVDGVAYGPYKTQFVLSQAAAPNPGGTGSKSGSDSTFPYLSSGSFVEAAGPLTVTVGSGEDVVCAFPATYAVYDTGFATSTLVGKWQSSPAGAGTWTDAPGSPIEGSEASFDPETFSGDPGYGQFNQTITGLSAGDYDIRFVAALNAVLGTPNLEIFGSTATVLVQ